MECCFRYMRTDFRFNVSVVIMEEGATNGTVVTTSTVIK